MSRTTVRPTDGQTTQNVTVAVPVVNYPAQYACHDTKGIQRKDGNEIGVTELLITPTQSGDPTLGEVISIKYIPQKTVSKHKLLEKYNESSTKRGYLLEVKDEYVARTTESDGTVHDDTECIIFQFKTQSGANIPDGAALLSKLMRLVGVCAPVIEQTNAKANDATYTLSTSILENLLGRVTKPAGV